MRGWVIWWAVPSDGVGNRRNGGIRPCFRRWFGLTREIPMHVELASLWKRSQVVPWRSRPLSTDSRGKKRVPSSSVRTRGNPRFFWPRDVSSRPTARRERASPLVREKEAEKPRRMAGTDVPCVPSSRRSPRSMAVNSRVNTPPPRSGPTPKSYMVPSQSQNRSTCKKTFHAVHINTQVEQSILQGLRL